MKNSVLAFLCLSVFVLSQSTCGNRQASSSDPQLPSDKQSVPGTADKAPIGPGTGSPETDYAEYCAACHGEKLSDFIIEEWKHGKAWNVVYRSISQGFENDGMPAFGVAFSKQEISDLTDYILEGIENIRESDFTTSESAGDEVIQSRDLTFRKEVLAEDFRVPWGIAFLPDGDMLVTERRGKLWRLKASGERSEITGVPDVRNAGQGGMQDVELHPDYKENGWVYLSFSKPVGANATTAVVRGKLKGDVFTEVEEIFSAEPALLTRHHYGARLQFDREGYLYITVGDRGRRDDNPQDLSNDCGKVHRVYDNGRAVERNHWYGLQGKQATIFTLGHRNPQGMALHPETGEIWIHEHGPRGGDEINLLQKGENYGWPVISYGINYNGTIFTEKTHEPGMMQPEHYWVPSIAPCGMDFVTGERWGKWQGDLLVGSLRYRYVARIIFEDGKVMGEEELMKDIGRVREIEMGPDGLIYIVAEEPGRIIRLSPM